MLSGMRFLAIATVLFCLGGTSAAQADDELITAQNTVLCLRGEDVVRASDPMTSRNQASLRALRCMRPGPGIRTVSMNTGASANLPTQVRFFPTGISGGVMLWALPSAFEHANKS